MAKFSGSVGLGSRSETVKEAGFSRRSGLTIIYGLRDDHSWNTFWNWSYGWCSRPHGWIWTWCWKKNVLIFFSQISKCRNNVIWDSRNFESAITTEGKYEKQVLTVSVTRFAYGVNFLWMHDFVIHWALQIISFE